MPVMSIEQKARSIMTKALGSPIKDALRDPECWICPSVAMKAVRKALKNPPLRQALNVVLRALESQSAMSVSEAQDLEAEFADTKTKKGRASLQKDIMGAWEDKGMADELIELMEENFCIR